MTILKENAPAATGAEKSVNFSEENINQDIEKYKHAVEEFMVADLDKSGLTINDFFVCPDYCGKPESHGYWINFVDPNTGNLMCGADGEPFRRKRLLIQRKNGQKYYVNKGAGNRVFIPLAAHRFFAENPSAPLTITEGEKKAAAATKNGFPCLGICGIWNWLESKEFRQTQDGQSYAISQDILQYLKEPRKVIMVYDSDSVSTQKKAREFAQCAERFATELHRQVDCTLLRYDLPFSLRGGADNAK